MRYAVIHYHEIGLKGNNRIHFERLLLRNIRAKAETIMENCWRESGQIVFSYHEHHGESAKDILSRIPGIAFFSPAKRTALDIDEIRNCVLEILKPCTFETFRITAQRHDKRFPHTSQQINTLLGKSVVDRYNKKAQMKNADINVKVEISNDCAYISLETIPGTGGMPTNPKQKAVALLSGGFDSPIAAYMMMKRGCEVILVHFHNQNIESHSVQNKIVRLAKQLSRYQQNTKLHIVPFALIQTEIIKHTESTMRMLVYRKAMLRIAGKIARQEKAEFLVLGDSLSQVASQTFQNLAATYANAEVHILSPLIGMDKDEIIKVSRKIGTFDISSQKAGDCCSFFMAKHPELNARILPDISTMDELIDEVIKEKKEICF